MKKYDYNFKIQLRAVPYASSSHVLEYRLDPNQDLTYEEEKTYFFGLFKRKVIKSFDTDWHQIRLFCNGVTSHMYDANDDFNYAPIWCESKNDLEYYKSQFNTYGDLATYIRKHNEKAREQHAKDRAAYLKSRKIIY